MAREFWRLNKSRMMEGMAMSESTLRRLTDVLRREFNDDVEKIFDCVFGLQCAKFYSTSIYDQSDPKQIKERYTKALHGIQVVEEALSEFGVPEIETLSDLIAGREDDSLLQRFDKSEAHPETSDMYGVTVSETKEHLTVLRHALENALDRLRVPRGAKPKAHQRWLAVFAAEALKDRGVKLTSYDDGTYFTVLSILFEECFEGVGSEAHRRHGAFALTVDHVELGEYPPAWHLPDGAIEDT